MTKEKIVMRQRIIERMAKIPLQQRQKWEEDLFQQLLSYLAKHSFKHIAMFYSFYPEVSVHLMMNRLMNLDYVIYLPCLGEKYQLEFAPYTKNTPLKTVFKKVKEPDTTERINPEQLDLVIVPGVGFTKDGYRIGHGGGYYDRFLAKGYSFKTLSLVFPIQLDNQINQLIEPHDQLVETVLIANA